MKKGQRSYIDRSHTVGRVGEVISCLLMLGIPIAIMTTYDVWPEWSSFLVTAGSLLAVFGPINIAGVISYMPILGTGYYIGAITGNMANLKAPCALNAIDVAKVSLGTEESDVVASLAVAVSSLVTMIVIALGVVLLVPLQPFLMSENVQIATQNMIPALFGSLTLTVLMSNRSGRSEIRGQWKMAVVPMLIVVLIHVFVVSLTGKEGVVMLLILPVLLLCGIALKKKGWIRMVPIEKTDRHAA